MKKVLLFGLPVLAIIIALYAIYVLRQPDQSPQDTPINPFDFASTTPNSSQGELEIMTRNGSTVAVPDFTKTDQPPVAGPDTGYQVAGEAESSYQILYFPDQAYFLVSLYAEPLGEVRLAAEADLRSRLELTSAELCSLNIEVKTDAQTNESYAGRNLGLSFCPGAVVLP